MPYFKVSYSSHRFAIWRALFGSYLFYYSLRVWPYSVELFGSANMIEKNYQIGNGWIHFFCGAQALLSCLFIFGYKRRIISLALWLLIVLFYHLNVFTYSIELPYISWLLLCCSLIPEGEVLNKEKSSAEWEFPPILFWGGWLVLGLSYTYSGLSKAQVPQWREGGATSAILQSYHAYEWSRSIISDSISIIFDRSIVLLEVFALPLFLIPTLRLWSWALLLLMNVGILITMNLTQLSLGIILTHLFLIEGGWWIHGRSKTFQ